MDLRSRCLVGCSFDNPSNESLTHPGVGEVLTTEDLEFPVLLDKSDDDDSTVDERVPKDSIE